MDETNIPAGWDLSATLALFRNLPLFDSASFPPTEGDVYFLVNEKSSQGTGQVFTNTYQFYRKTKDGKYLEVTVIEEHKLAELKLDASASDAESDSFHRVADLQNTAKTVADLPTNAKVRPAMSKLLGFVFDHRQVLVDSEAGQLAKNLNYQPEGRIRPLEYMQPRVSFLSKGKGPVEKIRIFGLEALLKDGTQTRKQLDSSDDPVLEVSIDASGKAKVEMPTQAH